MSCDKRKSPYGTEHDAHSSVEDAVFPWGKNTKIYIGLKRNKKKGQVNADLFRKDKRNRIPRVDGVEHGASENFEHFSRWILRTAIDCLWEPDD